MNDAIREQKLHDTGDVVLEEIWRIKGELSASYGHDVRRLFEETRKHEKLSGHPVANLQVKPRKAA